MKIEIIKGKRKQQQQNAKVQHGPIEGKKKAHIRDFSQTYKFNY